MEQGSERFGRHIIHATNNLFVILIMLRWFEEPHRFSKLRFFHNLFSLFLLPRPPFPCPILGLSFFFLSSWLFTRLYLKYIDLLNRWHFVVLDVAQTRNDDRQTEDIEIRCYPSLFYVTDVTVSIRRVPIEEEFVFAGFSSLKTKSLASQNRKSFFLFFLFFVSATPEQYCLSVFTDGREVSHKRVVTNM